MLQAFYSNFRITENRSPLKEIKETKQHSSTKPQYPWEGVYFICLKDCMSCTANLFSIAKNVLIALLVALLFLKQKLLSSKKPQTNKQINKTQQKTQTNKQQTHRNHDHNPSKPNSFPNKNRRTSC